MRAWGEAELRRDGGKERDRAGVRQLRREGRIAGWRVVWEVPAVELLVESHDRAIGGSLVAAGFEEETAGAHDRDQRGRGRGDGERAAESPRAAPESAEILDRADGTDHRSEQTARQHEQQRDRGPRDLSRRQRRPHRDLVSGDPQSRHRIERQPSPADDGRDRSAVRTWNGVLALRASGRRWQAIDEQGWALAQAA